MATTEQSSLLGILCIRLISTWAILHGLLTCFSGHERWNTLLYDVLISIPGAPYTLGLLLVVGGALALFASVKGPDLNITFNTKWFSITRKPFKVHTINKTIHLSYRLIKNVGFWILGGTFLLFSVGFWMAAGLYSEVSLASGNRDLLISILCVIMAKLDEPLLRNINDPD